LANDPGNATTIRLTRSRPEVDPGLARGQASLQQGNIELARREFEALSRFQWKLTSQHT
jgi:hypothetical protein